MTLSGWLALAVPVYVVIGLGALVLVAVVVLGRR